MTPNHDVPPAPRKARRPTPRKRTARSAIWLRGACLSTTIFAAMVAGASPTDVQPTRTPLMDRSASPIAFDAPAGGRSSRLHHRVAQASLAPQGSAFVSPPDRLLRADMRFVLAMTTPSTRQAATAAIATHRLDRPDAAIAARFASIPAAPIADFVVADARDRPSPVAVPADIPAAPAAEGTDAARAGVAGEVELAMPSVPLPTRRPVIAPLAPAAIPQPAAPRRAAEAHAGEPRAVPLLAYARPDAGSLSLPGIQLETTPGAANPRQEPGTAIYDISAATVYLPNGERLEAHSGLGTMRDDVRFVREKMRGPTPPHVYDLTLRESLFHGVQALRLNPVGGPRNIHDRVGLLAHTYMLGPRGDSNGCVSFKDYKRFLAAYRRGEIRRLRVVDRLDASSTPRSSLLARFFRS